MKIAEIEAQLERGECSEETLTLFKSALKRVPQNGRCQHCYTTAVSMPSHLHNEAISLIQYGLEQYCDNWFDRMRSYYNIAIILETNKDYVEAKQAYNDALSAIDPGKQSAYYAEFASHLMRMEMHINNFKYTDDLEKYYNIAIRTDAFSQAFQKKRFYRLIAEIIIYTKHNDLSRAKAAFASANEMLHPDFTGSLTRLLNRKGYAESNGASKESLDFLRRVKHMF